MTRTRKILLGTAAALAVGGAALAFSGAGAQIVGSGQMATAEHGMMHRAGWRGDHRFEGRGSRHGFARWCSDKRTERLERMIGFGEAFFKFDGGQKTAWQGLTATLREASNDIGQRCEVAKNRERAKTPTERFARVEERLTAHLAVVQKVRPAFDRFYGTLDDTQKAALDDFMKHRGRR